MKVRVLATIIAIGPEKDGFYSATAELSVTERKLADGNIKAESELIDVSSREPLTLGQKILTGSLTARKKGARDPRDFNLYVNKAEETAD